MKTVKTNHIRPAYQVAGIVFGIILTIAFSSCQSKKLKEQIGRLEFSKDSMAQNLHQRDSLLGDMMDAFNQIEQSLNYIKDERRGKKDLSIAYRLGIKKKEIRNILESSAR